MIRKKSEPIPIFILGIVYLLSVIFLIAGKDISSIYEMGILFSVSQSVAKIFNIFFLLLNSILIHKIFTKRDISASAIIFVYLFVHNKIWFLNSVSSYLISDFIILITLLILYSQTEKINFNIIVFYLSVLFGVEFLLGVNLFYALIIPVLLFNIFLLFDWRTWIIFISGFLFPTYLFISINWLADNDVSAHIQNVSGNAFPLIYEIFHSSWKNMFSEENVSFYFRWESLNFFLILVLSVLSGIKEASEVYYYSLKERRIGLFFFFLLFFSLINCFFTYSFYHQYNFSVISLPFAYYVGNFLIKTSAIARYFVLFLLFVLVSFL